MSKKPMLLAQFRSFCFQNNPKDLDDALKYFAVFGGTGWSVDTTQPLADLIENKILKNYTYIHGDITKLTKSDKVSHSLLSAAALGDGRVHSALKRARISRGEGEEAIDTLCERGVIKREFSLESPPDSDEKIDEKLNFATPFLRFWFAFISPFFKTIKEGDYKEAKEKFANRELEFFELLFLKLSHELIKKSFKEDAIVEIGSYWDRNIQIDILAKTASGKIVAGICKYSGQKAKKSDLSKLKDLCEAAQLTPDIYTIVSKSGFKIFKPIELKIFAL